MFVNYLTANERIADLKRKRGNIKVVVVLVRIESVGGRRGVEGVLYISGEARLMWFGVV